MAEGELGSSAVLDVDVMWFAANCSAFAKNLRIVSESLEKRERDLEKRERELGELKSLQEGRLRLKEAMLDEYLRSINEKMETLKAVEGRVEDLRREQVDELNMIEEKEKEVKKREQRIAALFEGEEASLLAWQEREEKHTEIEQWLERLDARDKDLDQRENAVRKFELQQHSTNASTAGVD